MRKVVKAFSIHWKAVRHPLTNMHIEDSWGDREHTGLKNKERRIGKAVSPWWEDLPCGSQDSCRACFYRCRLMRNRNKKPKVTARLQLSTSDKSGFKVAFSFVTNNFSTTVIKITILTWQNCSRKRHGVYSTKTPNQTSPGSLDMQVRMQHLALQPGRAAVGYK